MALFSATLHGCAAMQAGHTFQPSRSLTAMAEQKPQETGNRKEVGETGF